MSNIETLQQWIDESNRIVFFGGAGVSTESGIPDFRSQDGLYHQEYKYPPETIVSHTFYVRNPQEFYRFYRDKMIITTAEPNAAHKKLAELEEAGKLTAIVTQNIDGLHKAALVARLDGIDDLFFDLADGHRLFLEGIHLEHAALVQEDAQGGGGGGEAGHDHVPQGGEILPPLEAGEEEHRMVAADDDGGLRGAEDKGRSGRGVAVA